MSYGDIDGDPLTSPILDNSTDAPMGGAVFNAGDAAGGGSSWLSGLTNQIPGLLNAWLERERIDAARSGVPVQRGPAGDYVPVAEANRRADAMRAQSDQRLLIYAAIAIGVVLLLRRA